jgi:hypothetical protein
MKTTTDLGELLALEGAVDHSPWVQVEPARSNAYAQSAYHDLVYSPDPDLSYPDGLVDGFHLLGLLDWLVAEVVGTFHGYNYGLDSVRFTAPVTVHDWIRLRLAVVDVRPRSGGLLLTYNCIVEIKEQTRPAMVATWKVLALPIPTAEQRHEPD